MAIWITQLIFFFALLVSRLTTSGFRRKGVFVVGPRFWWVLAMMFCIVHASPFGFFAWICHGAAACWAIQLASDQFVVMADGVQRKSLFGTRFYPLGELKTVKVTPYWPEEYGATVKVCYLITLSDRLYLSGYYPVRALLEELRELGLMVDGELPSSTRRQRIHLLCSFLVACATHTITGLELLGINIMHLGPPDAN